MCQVPKGIFSGFDWNKIIKPERKTLHKLPFLHLSLEISEPSVSPVTSTVPPTSASNQQKEKKKKKKDPSKGRWVEGITSEGHHYYYNLITGGTSFRHKDSRK